MVDDAWGRLTHLIKFIKGEAKEMVKTCMKLPPEVGFKTAKRLLHERYGDHAKSQQHIKIRSKNGRMLIEKFRTS